MNIKMYSTIAIAIVTMACVYKKNNTNVLFTGDNIGAISTNTNSEAINHDAWDVLVKKHVSAKGNVSYKGFQKDASALEKYLDQLSKNAPSSKWSKNETLAYWINAYNAYTVKLILDNYPTSSIKNISSPWDKKFIVIEGKKYSLGNIEHDILRKMNEPRIHFAINCASYSCPNLLNAAYEASTIDAQLTTAAKSFLADDSKNSITASKVTISMIFKWFSGDFKTEGSLIAFLNKYSTTTINANAKVKYKSYNWTLNE